MDVIFVPSNGKHFTLRIEFYDKVLEIKNMIQQCHGFPIASQTLFFNGNEMWDEFYAGVYMLSPGSCINLKLEPESRNPVQVQEPMRVFLIKIVHPQHPRRCFPFHVDVMDTVINLKERIHQDEGIPVSRFVLFIGDVQLQDHRPLSDYEISAGSHIFLMEIQEPMMIKILHSHGDFSVGVDAKDTVIKLKERIQQDEGIPVGIFVLFIGDVQLQDHRPLSDYGISDGSHILLMPEFESRKRMKVHVLFMFWAKKQKRTLEVDAMDTIIFLKNRLCQLFRFPVHRCMLMLGYTELQDHQTLADYGVSDGSQVGVLIRPFPMVTPTMRSMHNTEHYQMFQGSNIHLMPEPESRKRIKVQEPVKDHRALADYRVSDQSQVDVLVRSTPPATPTITSEGWVMLDELITKPNRWFRRSNIHLMPEHKPVIVNVWIQILRSPSQFPLQVDVMDTVINLKKRICQALGKQGIDVVLVCRRTELEKDLWTLANYGVSEQSKIAVIIKLPEVLSNGKATLEELGTNHQNPNQASNEAQECMKIHIVIDIRSTETLIPMVVNMMDTTAQLKKMIYLQSGMEISIMDLYFNTVKLQDDQTLADQGVLSWSVVTVYVRPEGSGGDEIAG